MLFLLSFLLLLSSSSLSLSISLSLLLILLLLLLLLIITIIIYLVHDIWHALGCIVVERVGWADSRTQESLARVKEFHLPMEVKQLQFNAKI